MREIDVRVRTIAAGQFAVVSRSQCASAGMTALQLRRRVEWGALVQLNKRVFKIPGSTDSFEQRAMARLLDAPAGSGLSFLTAAAWFDVPGFELEPIHISGPRSRRSDRDRLKAVWHHPTFLPSHHLRVVNGLTVTSPSRLAADLANLPDVHPKRATRGIESMWARGLTNRKRLQTMADEWCERGRRGSAFLHTYLAERPIEWRPPESSLERRFIDIVKEAGFPSPVSQVNLGSNDAWFGRVDLKDPELPLIAEIDSDRFHAAPLDREADASRDEAATDAGFVVRRFSEFDVWHNPSAVVDGWREARRLARKRAAS